MRSYVEMQILRWLQDLGFALSCKSFSQGAVTDFAEINSAKLHKKTLKDDVLEEIIDIYKGSQGDSAGPIAWIAPKRLWARASSASSRQLLWKKMPSYQQFSGSKFGAENGNQADAMMIQRTLPVRPVSTGSKVAGTGTSASLTSKHGNPTFNKNDLSTMDSQTSEKRSRTVSEAIVSPSTLPVTVPKPAKKKSGTGKINTELFWNPKLISLLCR
jgi:hypothetical protein